MKINEVVLDGSEIRSEEDFHEQLSAKLDLGNYYGRNLDALWDRLSTDIERPFKITWVDSEISRKNLGSYFDKIIQIFEDTKQQDISFNWDEKFDYELR